MAGVSLIPLGFADTMSLERLASDLERILRLPVRIARTGVQIEEALDRSRNQYHCGHVLALLLAKATDDDTKLLGITSFDLFLPVLTFVFGQAQLNNRGAVFSTFRLHNEFYGLPPSHLLLRERALKEALHELGHTFGLRHCFGSPCVMNPSTYVEDIDYKPAEFCSECAKTIKES